MRYFTGQDVSSPIDAIGVKLADTARPMVGRHAATCSGHEDRRPALRHRARLPDGDYALLDHVYLARTPQDFDHCPPQATPLSIGK